jgi:hypothetical protein
LRVRTEPDSAETASYVARQARRGEAFLFDVMTMSHMPWVTEGARAMLTRAVKDSPVVEREGWLVLCTTDEALRALAGREEATAEELMAALGRTKSALGRDGLLSQLDEALKGKPLPDLRSLEALFYEAGEPDMRVMRPALFGRPTPRVTSAAALHLLVRMGWNGKLEGLMERLLATDHSAAHEAVIAACRDADGAALPFLRKKAPLAASNEQFAMAEAAFHVARRCKLTTAELAGLAEEIRLTRFASEHVAIVLESRGSDREKALLLARALDDFWGYESFPAVLEGLRGLNLAPAREELRGPLLRVAYGSADEGVRKVAREILGVWFGGAPGAGAHGGGEETR